MAKKKRRLKKKQLTQAGLDIATGVVSGTIVYLITKLIG